MKQRILMLVVVAGLAVPWPAMPCRCMPTFLKESLEKYDAVFVGKVVRLEVLRSQNGVDTVRGSLERCARNRIDRVRLADEETL
jgi:hypothetical protein